MRRWGSAIDKILKARCNVMMGHVRRLWGNDPGSRRPVHLVSQPRLAAAWGFTETSGARTRASGGNFRRQHRGASAPKRNFGPPRRVARWFHGDPWDETTQARTSTGRNFVLKLEAAATH